MFQAVIPRGCILERSGVTVAAMAFTDMIVKPFFDDDLEIFWSVTHGSRKFLVTRNERGDWGTVDVDETDVMLDVSRDLSGALEYIHGLFRPLTL